MKFRFACLRTLRALRALLELRGALSSRLPHICENPSNLRMRAPLSLLSPCSKLVRIVLIALPLFAPLTPTLAASNDPIWWELRGVVTPGTEHANDFAAANIGQLKWFVTQAEAELLACFPGLSNDYTSALDTLPGPKNDFAAANLGQLKSVARPIYDALHTLGSEIPYPWQTTPANDVALLNLGQLKAVFEVEFADHACADPDGDGLGNADEYLIHTDPRKADTDGDGLSDQRESLLGTNPRDNDTDDDGLPDGWEWGHGLLPWWPDEGEDPDDDLLTNLEEYSAGSHPQTWDSDGDLLRDYEEEYVYLTGPASDDTDEDGLVDSCDLLVAFADDSRGDLLLVTNGVPTMNGAVTGSVYELLSLFTDGTIQSSKGLVDGDVSGAVAWSNWLDGAGAQLPYESLRAGLADDADGDGLGTAYEVLLGLSPDVPDSDLDGVQDGLDDPDMDGLLTVDEYNQQPYGQGATSPTCPDTDGDGVSDGPLAPELARVLINCPWLDTPGYALTAGPDAFPLDPAASVDTDGDGMPDVLTGESLSDPPLVEDLDDDNDGIPDLTDAEPTVFNSNDIDSDGMPDDWEQTIVDDDTSDSIDTVDEVLRTDDYDDDGVSNFVEYESGTSPIDSDDHIPVVSFSQPSSFATAQTSHIVNVTFQMPAVTRQWDPVVNVAIAGGTLVGSPLAQMVSSTASQAVPTVSFIYNGLPPPLSENTCLLHLNSASDALISSQTAEHLLTLVSAAGADTEGGTGDGLPDAWEQQIIDADPNDAITSIADVLPGDDFDGDGITNRDEYLFGSNPTLACTPVALEDLNVSVETPGHENK